MEQRGENYLDQNYGRIISDTVAEKGGSLKLLRSGVGNSDRALGINLKMYEGLASQGYEKEAGFMLKTLKKSIGIMERKFGEDIIDYSKLPVGVQDYLKK